MPLRGRVDGRELVQLVAERDWVVEQLGTLLGLQGQQSGSHLDEVAQLPIAASLECDTTVEHACIEGLVQHGRKVGAEAP